jgi:hypothetical protein
MATLDIAKIKSRLQALQNSSSKASHLWKIPPGKSTVRIIPYSHQPENPFIELFFHYGMNGKTYISPSSFGRPDPIVEFSNKLKKTGDKQEWKQGRDLEPKMRTYVPILVRGHESEGVKFWGMGKTVYQDILGVIADPDYGDITDLKNGRDISIEFKTALECGKDYPETSIRVKPNVSLAFDPTDKALLEKVKNQKNVVETWPELSYEELAVVMDTWLNASEAASAGTDTETPNTVANPAEIDATEVNTVSSTLKAAVKAPTTKAIADEFNDLFNS